MNHSYTPTFLGVGNNLIEQLGELGIHLLVVELPHNRFERSAHLFAGVLERLVCG